MPTAVPVVLAQSLCMSTQSPARSPVPLVYDPTYTNTRQNALRYHRSRLEKFRDRRGKLFSERPSPVREARTQPCSIAVFLTG